MKMDIVKDKRDMEEEQ